MSTEIAPPPPEQQALATESATKDFTPQTFNLTEVLKTHSRANLQSKTAEKQPAAKKEDAKPVDPPKEEKPVETEKKTEAAVEKKFEPPKKESEPERPTREHFKAAEASRDEARAAAEAAKAEAETWRKKFEEAQGKPDPAAQQRIDEYEKQLEELRKSHEEMRAKVRQVDVQLDPEFEKQYTVPVQKAQREVYELLVRGGASKEDAASAVTNWNDGEFSTITEGMTEIQKRRVDAAILETERLAKVRQSQITQPENYAEQRKQQEQQAREQTVKQRQREAEDIINGLLSSTEALRSDEHKPLVDAIRGDLSRAAKGEITPKEVFGFIAQAKALQVGLKGQHEALVEMQAQIAEKDKKIADLEAFVKANGGSTLKSETGSAASEEYVPLTQRLKVVA